MNKSNYFSKTKFKLEKCKNSNYQAGPLSKTGIYLIEIDFNYSGKKTETFKQFFLFRITSDSPSVEIYTQDESTKEKTYLNNEEYTFKDVIISKSSLDVFDSKSTLIVYKDTTFSGSYDAGVEILDNQTTTFTETAKYKVELKYGNDGKKGFISYFVIPRRKFTNRPSRFTFVETKSKWGKGCGRI